MSRRLFRFLRRLLVLLVVVAATLLVVRAWDAQRAGPLDPWHTYVPHDGHAPEIDKADWAAYLKAEEAVFREVRTEVVDKLDEEARTPGNRYYEGSPIYPGNFAQDWNRSYVLEPDGPPVGAVVLLHGLTDSPYSLRHVARLYRDARLRGCGDQDAGPWHRAGRTDRHRMGGLGRRHAARRAGGAPARRARQAAAHRRLLQRRRAGDEIRPRCARRRTAGTARSTDPDLADDRHHGVRALCRDRRLAGDVSRLRQGGVARHRARVQSVQVQFLPRQRRASVAPTDRSHCRIASSAPPAKASSADCRRS